ncbi:MAG: hypothetical protein ACJ73E_10265 [Mycobacteriales bacterium]
MTETPGTESFAWQRSQATRAEERAYEARAGMLPEARRAQAGWADFAVTVLFMAAAFQIIDGLIALLNSDTYPVGTDRLAVNVDYSVWGWFHLGLGLLGAVAAFGLLAGRMWARVVGIVMAWVSMIANVVFIPAYPFASVALIVLDVLVIYAIAVHGGALRDD